MTHSTKWSLTGVLIGACFALVSQAPATWLAKAINNASQQRFVLQSAQGRVWQGSALALLADGSQAAHTLGTPFAEVIERLWDGDTQIIWASIISFWFGSQAFSKK